MSKPALAWSSACLLAFAACDGGSPTTTVVTVSISNATAHPAAASGDPDPTTPDPTTPDPTTPDPDPVVPDPTTPDPDPVVPDPTPTPDPVAGPDAIAVTAFPFIDQNDTTAGTRTFDHYACAPSTHESGPEVLYRVELPAEGLLTASVDDMPSGVDVDVQLLSSPSASDCIDRGNTHVAALLPAGTYWVVADSWVDAAGTEKAGAYTLTIGFTTADAFVAQGLDAHVLSAGLYAFDAAWREGATDRLEYTVVDFSKPSGQVRLWTLQLADGSLLFDERVSHGEGSEDPDHPGYSNTFSNVEGSHQSNLGLVKTDARFIGDKGLALTLDGLEDGVNDLARPRAILVHSATYASADYAAAHGRLGDSWGCYVVDPVDIDEVVGTIENGSLLWGWYPDPAFIAGSHYLQGWSD